MNKFYISTTIPYINGDPHIGHALEFVEADVIARYRRVKGDDVFFLTGTDENSLKNIQAAEKAGVPVREFVDEYAKRFRELVKALTISNDDFIRTTEERHIRGAQKLWEACAKAGDIYKKQYRGLYCVGCELFYLEKDLANGLCPEHKTKPELIEEENYFFKLSRYGEKIGKFIESGALQIIPEKRKAEMLTFVREGLEDFSISRSNARAKHWGVSVPGDSSQKMYVWFDALSNYVNAVGYADDEPRFKSWWTENPEIVHVLGKGVARFHALYWPGMLLSAGLRLPTELFIHGYITLNGEKISKSFGNVVNPTDLVKKYGTDAVRYFLLRGVSAYEDGDFSEDRFKEIYNADLANGIGNLVQRVTTLGEKAKFTDIRVATGKFETDVERVKKEVRESLERYEFHRAIEHIWELVSLADKYVNETKVWGKDGEEQKKILADLTSVILNIANLLDLFLPKTAEKILKRFGLTIAEIRSPKVSSLYIKKGEPLFQRLV